jgi:DNA-binding CsgD family transcriptional regulator
VRRAAAIGKVIDFHKASEATLSSVVERLAGAVFLLDRRARIGYANSKALALLDAGEVVRATSGVLSAAEVSADKSLRDAVLAAVDGDIGIGVRGVAVPLSTHFDMRYVAHVLPLASHARRAAAGGHAAAVFIHHVTLDRPSPLELMARLYKLTASEVRVLQAITQTSGVAELAREVGISVATVKTHLNRLFAKTGAKRQADLVRLLAAHTSPLDG